MTESLTPGIKLTPMMEQYRSIQKTLPDNTILFFRLGDFYEMFFEDAVRASEILDITLTGREGGEAGRIPMCGIPYHAFQGYVRTLVDHNLKVAICEQIGDPKLSKGIVERKVTRIISPATYLEDDSKNAGAEYMAAIVVCPSPCPLPRGEREIPNPAQKENRTPRPLKGGEDTGEGGKAALAYLDLGTGEFFVRETDPNRLISELTILNPREVILPKSLSEESGPLIAFLKESLNVTLSIYEDWVFEPQEGARLLKENFKLASEKSISFYDRPLSLGAAGGILYYLRDHLHHSLAHVRVPVLMDASSYMILDREAQKSLEIVSNIRRGDPAGRPYTTTLLGAIDQTLTSMGARMLYYWVTRPLLNLQAIGQRQDGISEFIGKSSMMQALRGLLKGVKDMERTLSRLNCGLANARDLVNLEVFLKRVPEIRFSLGEAQSLFLKNILQSIREFPALVELISKSIAEEPPLGLKDGGIIRDGFSAELDDLRSISKSGKSWIADFERREAERSGIKSLKVKYSHVFGYAIEISKSNLPLVPSDYIRRQTLANAERFVVPELKEWDEKISGAEDKIKLMEYRIFDGIREKVLESLEPLQSMAKAVGELDALISLAVTALQKSWVRPEVTETSELHIQGGRHPVVEAMLAHGQFVENDTLLDGANNQLIILTGPNMAGKSTYIRQVGLITLLAQMGSYIPAQSARIGIVDRIFTRIGASDDLSRGESTFMVEMLETAHILQSATSRSLLILDEVGRGTSTFDGVSIAWAICEYLAQGKLRPRTLFATHYHELTQLEDHFPAIKNYNILVRETKDGIIFLRKVVAGGSDRSYGIHVARLAGIPESVTRRAQEILAILESENTEATEIIEGKGGKKKKSNAFQPSLFDAGFGTANSSPLLDEIRQTDINQITPLDALAKIAEWKQKLK